MAYVYQNIIIGDELSVGQTGAILSREQGYLITGDGTSSIVLPPGTDGQVLSVNSDQVTGTVSLEWRDAGENIGAGAGLAFDPATNTLNVVGSDTILVGDGEAGSTDNVQVNSNAVAGMPLLSSGTVGTPAVYGALDLTNDGASGEVVTGVLPVANGGTGTDTFTPGTIVVVDETTGNLVSGPASSALPTTYTTTTSDATPVAIATIATVASTSYTLTINVLGRSTDGSTANFRIRATVAVDAAGTTIDVIGEDLASVRSADLAFDEWNASVDGSGTNIFVNVTGAAAETITWVATVEILSVTV